MAKASKGLLRGTRRKMKKALRSKFKPETYMRKFKEGDMVIIKPHSASQKGLPHPRFVGRAGTVTGMRSGAVMVSLRVGGKEKQVFARPEHLKKA